jgi:hypothetical protein
MPPPSLSLSSSSVISPHPSNFATSLNTFNACASGVDAKDAPPSAASVSFVLDTNVRINLSP